MAKGNEKNGKGLELVDGIKDLPKGPLTPKEASEERIEMLTKAVFAAIDAVANEHAGKLLIAEVNDVLLKVNHSYNKRALTAEIEGQTQALKKS